MFPSKNRIQTGLRGVAVHLSSLVFLTGIGCLYNPDASDRVLYGLTDQLGGPPGSRSSTTDQTSCSTELITVSSQSIDIIEDGDVTRTWQAASPGFSDVDADAGTAWGLRSTEVCIYPNNAFNGTVEIPLSTNGSYSGRLDVETSHPSAGDPVPSSLTFTGDGSTGHGTASRQCFTITRIDDGIRNPVEDPYELALGAITVADDDDIYAGQDPCDITVTMEDDEAPGIRVSNISNIMQEPGTGGTNNGTFQVKLRTDPTASVTIGINDLYDAKNVGHREGTVDKSTLVFTDSATTETVTVTSVDDLEIDGTKDYIIAVTTAVSADPEYNGLEPRDVVVYNEDQSVPGYVYNITHSSTSGQTGISTTTTNGMAVDQMNNMGSTYATFTLSLRSKPEADILLTFNNPRTDIVNLVTTSLTFTTNNWNTPQTVTVEGASNGTDFGTGNGNEDVTISFTASLASGGSDPTYPGTSQNFSVRSCDNDNTHLIQPCNLSGSSFGDTRGRFSSAEPSGTSAIWLISKAANPGSTTINTVSTDTSEGTVPATVTVDNSNYNTMTSGGTNRIAISHQDDGIVDSTQTFSITTTYNSGAVNYDPYDTLAQTTDNEQYFYINTTGNTSEANAGTLATVYVCLGAQNDAAVTLNLACSTPGDECGTITSSPLTWATTNLQSDATSNATCTSSSTNVRSFTVSGLDDTFADGNQSFSINITSATGGGSNYFNRTPTNPSITNLDNENPGKAIFVTTNTFNGEFTAAGVQGADTVCNNSGNKPSGVPSGTYKALMSGVGETNTRNTSTDWVITPNYYYYRCESGGAANCSDENTRLFIADGSGLFNAGSMSGGRDFSSNTGYTFWTGMNLNLSIADQADKGGAGDPAVSDNCAGFTYRDRPTAAMDWYEGGIWESGGSDNGAQTTNTDTCDQVHRVICVQQ